MYIFGSKTLESNVGNGNRNGNPELELAMLPLD